MTTEVRAGQRLVGHPLGTEDLGGARSQRIEPLAVRPADEDLPPRPPVGEALPAPVPEVQAILFEVLARHLPVAPRLDGLPAAHGDRAAAGVQLGLVPEDPARHLAVRLDLLDAIPGDVEAVDG